MENEKNEKLHYVMNYLTPAMIEEARTELNETDEVRAKSIKELRLLIEKEKNLVAQTDDEFLLQFLRSRKFSVKSALKLLQNYYHFRTKHRSVYDKGSAEDVKKVVLRNFLGNLLYRDRKGCIVFLFKVGKWNPDIVTFNDVFLTITSLLISANKYPATQICGYRVIFDLRGMTWTQMKMCTPGTMYLCIQSTQFCFPARYKGIHIISDSKILNLIWANVYPFLTSKLKKRIMVHGLDLEPLSDYIHPSVLPNELGGLAGPYDNHVFDKIFDDSVSTVLNQLNYGYQK